MRRHAACWAAATIAAARAPTGAIAAIARADTGVGLMAKARRVVRPANSGLLCTFSPSVRLVWKQLLTKVQPWWPGPWPRRSPSPGVNMFGVAVWGGLYALFFFFFFFVWELFFKTKRGLCLCGDSFF